MHTAQATDATGSWRHPDGQIHGETWILFDFTDLYHKMKDEHGKIEKKGWYQHWEKNNMCD